MRPSRSSLLSGFFFVLGVALPLQGALASSEPVLTRLPAEIHAALRSEGGIVDLAELRRTTGVDLRGLSCPTNGCAPGPRSRAADLAAFGCAAFGGVWLARRRTQRSG